MVSTMQYQTVPSASPRALIPVHITVLDHRTAYIPYPTALLHDYSEEEDGCDGADLPWIRIATSASEIPHSAAAAILPPQPRPRERPVTCLPETYVRHRRLSRKPISADLRSLYSRSRGDAGGISRSSSSSSSSSRKRRSSSDSIQSYEVCPDRHWTRAEEEEEENEEEDGSAEYSGSFFTSKAVLQGMGRSADGPETTRPSAPQISPQSILRFVPTPRHARKRVTFKREWELEEMIDI